MGKPVRRPLRRRIFVGSAVLLLLANPILARAATPGDPFEGLNRRSYAFSRAFDRALGKAGPLLATLFPKPVRRALHNIIGNLKEPGVAINDLLQGHPKTAGRTTTRFIANSTFGLGGIFDVATRGGLPHHDNGFGTTFGRYGAGPGPYLFLPLMGPSTIRDLAGSGADITTDPLTWTRFDGRVPVIIARAIIDGLDQREQGAAQLQAIDNMSTDSYATLRSLYLQNRAADVAAAKGLPADAETPLPDFDAPAAPATALPATAPPAPPATPSAGGSAQPADTPAPTVEPAPAR